MIIELSFLVADAKTGENAELVWKDFVANANFRGLRPVGERLESRMIVEDRHTICWHQKFKKLSRIAKQQ